METAKFKAQAKATIFNWKPLKQMASLQF